MRWTKRAAEATQESIARALAARTSALAKGWTTRTEGSSPKTTISQATSLLIDRP